MVTYISRLALMQQEIQKIRDRHQLLSDDMRPCCYYIFTERSVCTDYEIFAKMLYDQGKIEEINYQIYMKWFHCFAQHLPNVYIYIETQPNICLERIATRARDGESNIPLDYLTTCHAYHDAMFGKKNNESNDKLLVLCGNKPDNHVELILQIQSFLQI